MRLWRVRYGNETMAHISCLGMRLLLVTLTTPLTVATPEKTLCMKVA